MKNFFDWLNGPTCPDWVLMIVATMSAILLVLCSGLVVTFFVWSIFTGKYLLSLLTFPGLPSLAVYLGYIWRDK